MPVALGMTDKLTLLAIRRVHLRNEAAHYQITALLGDDRFRILVRRTLPDGPAIGTGLPEHEHLRGAELLATWTDATARRLIESKRLDYGQLAAIERLARDYLIRHDGDVGMIERQQSILGDPVYGAREPESSKAIAKLFARHRKLRNGRERARTLLLTTRDHDGWHARLRAEIEPVAGQLSAIDDEIQARRCA